MNSGLHWNSTTPYSKQFDDLYFDFEDGFGESQYVFLEANDIPHRFADQKNETPFFICETGFGTGLNFFNAIYLLSSIKNSPTLEFYSCELYPLAGKDILHALSPFPKIASWTKNFLDQYNPDVAGWQRVIFTNPDANLHLYIGDVHDMLAEMVHQKLKIDAWFLDGFAPAKNPLMWRPETLLLTRPLSKNTTTLSSFTSAGAVRRNLAQAGFEIQKIPGFGKKREMIRGVMKTDY